MIVKPQGGWKSKNRDPLHQPQFDPRIRSTHIPGAPGSGKATIQRGYMVWENVLPGYSHRCVFRYLFNPTTVEASYSVADSGVTASLIFPNANDQSDLRIPINQYASWSILFDRTYELWGSYDDNGQPRYKNFAAGNDPRTVGVWADVIQLQEFTGMNVAYSPGTGGATAAGTGKNGGSQTLTGHQGIMQMVPAWAFFGSQNNLHYYGYISAWDVTYTHFTQYNVPMRCAVDITFTLLPPPNKQPNLSWVAGNGGYKPPNLNGATLSPGTPGPGNRGGR
jgi:hypothetical protein